MLTSSPQHVLDVTDVVPKNEAQIRYFLLGSGSSRKFAIRNDWSVGSAPAFWFTKRDSIAVISNLHHGNGQDDLFHQHAYSQPVVTCPIKGDLPYDEQCGHRYTPLHVHDDTFACRSGCS